MPGFYHVFLISFFNFVLLLLLLSRPQAPTRGLTRGLNSQPCDQDPSRDRESDALLTEPRGCPWFGLLKKECFCCGVVLGTRKVGPFLRLLPEPSWTHPNSTSLGNLEGGDGHNGGSLSLRSCEGSPRQEMVLI